MSGQRIVELSRGAFVELSQALEPTERWTESLEPHRANKVLWSWSGQFGWEPKKLLFVAKPPKPPSAGVLEVGTTGKGEIVVNHPDIDPDKDGVGHIVFSPAQARNLARLLMEKADEASREKHG